MSKLVLMLLFGLASVVIIQVRKAQARKRLEELDSGQRCMACNGTDVETFRGQARCKRCGHTVSLAGLRSSHVSDKEIEAIVKPDDRQL